MLSYNFYYDESEHSRKINYKTISADNYYDNFIVAIVGWSKEKEQSVFDKYCAFEEKYANRKDANGELKSTTLKQNRFKYGFASLNKQNVQFIDDFFSVFDEEIHFYFALSSKIEYIILQLFEGYQNSFLIDADAMKYSITKALVVYQPKEIVKCLCENPEKFVDALKSFLKDRIEANRKKPALKQKEINAFEQMLMCLDSISAIPEQHWDYRISFDGFRKYLNEEDITDYFLLLDKEGEEHEDSKTLNAAKEVGITNIDEANSKNSCGLRIADMMAGIMSKLLKSLCDSLRDHSFEEGTEKKLLDIRWFQLNDAQLTLYKKLYRIICIWDDAWYKAYSGIYSDDLIVFIALLNYMGHFESASQIKHENVEMQNEYFNAFACKQLNYYFGSQHHKLPFEPIRPSDNDYFFNRKGAKVYYDISRQPLFSMREGSRTVEVLSVGMSRSGHPLMTITEDGRAVCYQLPSELSDWAYTVIGFADRGSNLFPSRVRFVKNKGRYYVDVL